MLSFMSRCKFDHPNRRRFLAAGLAALGSGVSFALPVSNRAEEILALRKLAAEKGLLYGTTISARQITGDPRFVDLVLQQTGLVVAENDMKWQVMNRGAGGDDDYGPADTVAAFALQNDRALRGHNLLWYHRTPNWFFDLDNRQDIEAAIVERIRGLAGRYRGMVHSWDVVNEPIEPKDGRPDGLRTGVFLEMFGPDYLDLTDENAPADEAVRDRLLDDAYSRFLDAALDEPAVKMVVTCGLSDRHSWIVRKETHESKWRADGLPSRPLPFDADLKPKPAFEAIAQAFVHAPQRAAR